MAYNFKNASVLVLDDMPSMLDLVTSILKIQGFEKIHIAKDPDEGFEKFLKHNQDIILTDWLMEPYDGIEFTKKIRNDPRSPNRFVPVVMMTGYSHRIRVEEARDAGVTEFLVKPFRAIDLCKRIEQLIEKPRRFVDSTQFFGPDRRRRKESDYDGPFRREIDTEPKPVEDKKGDKKTDNLLKELREQASKIGRTD